MPAPYGDGLYAIEPPAGNGLNITDIFHIVGPKPGDPDIGSRVDSKYPNVAIITFDDTNQFGGMWAKEKLDLTMPFQTEMYLHLGRKYGKSGSVADGMTFTLQNDSAGINAIGGAGEGLGVYKGRKWTGAYYQGNPVTEPHGTYLRNSLVVEFDTYRNQIAQSASVDDPAGVAHCAVLIPRADRIYQQDHNTPRSFTPAQDWVRFAAEWTPDSNGGGMLYYEFGGNIKESFLVLNTQATFGGTGVYWGFTGATGQLTSVQAAAITRLPVQGVTVEKTVKNAAGDDVNHGRVLRGEALTYTVRATAATLNEPVGPITIEDVISGYTEYIADSVQVFTKGGGAYSGTVSFSGNTLSVNSTQYLAAQGDWIEISFKVRVKDDAAGMVILNQAGVGGEGLPAPLDTNITGVTVFAEPEKRVSENSAAGKNGSEVSAGDLITYEIEFANDTGDDATVVVTDTLDHGLDFKSASDGGVYNDVTHTVTWTFTGVPSGPVRTVALTVSVNKDAVARVENGAGVTVNGNRHETGIVTNPVAPEKPVKTVSAGSEAGRDGKAVKAGDRITYGISYRNYTENGGEVTITDRLPAGVDYMASNPEGVYDKNSHTVTWTLDVPAGDSGAVSLQVRVNKTASYKIANLATVKVAALAPQNTNIVVNPISGFRCPDIRYRTRCRTAIKGKKIWNDNENAGNTRPAVVEIILRRDGERYRSASASSADGWAYAFTCLPVFKKRGAKYVYTVDEAAVPHGYVKTTGGYNIINTLDV